MPSLLLLLLLLVSCTPAGTRVASGRGTEPQGPQPTRTAAEADGPDESAPCQSVDDCTLTHYRSGEACPTLCTPRPVTKDAAAALQQQARSDDSCPSLPCRTVPAPRRLACEQGRCVSEAPPGTQR